MTPAGSGETEPAFFMHFLNKLPKISVRVKYDVRIMAVDSRLRRNDEEMEQGMVFKISPNPSLPKRGMNESSCLWVPKNI